MRSRYGLTEVSFFGLRLGVQAAALATILLALPVERELRAAPLIFAFEAEISEVQGDVAALDLPFSLVVGQRFSGQYVFESEQDLLDILIHPLGKQALVTLLIDGSELEAVTNFGSINDGGPIDINGPTPVPSSSLSLGYLPVTDRFPGWAGQQGVAHPWNVGLKLVGDEGVISSSDDLLNVNIWNELTTLRSLSLVFGYPNTVSVQANVGTFISVPEPSAAGCLLAILLLTSAKLIHIRKKS